MKKLCTYVEAMYVCRGHVQPLLRQVCHSLRGPWRGTHVSEGRTGVRYTTSNSLLSFDVRAVQLLRSVLPCLPCANGLVL